MIFVPLLAAWTDNPALLVVGFMIVVSIIQQIGGAKQAFDKTAASQRAERDAAAAGSAAAQPAGAQPAGAQPARPAVSLPPGQPTAMPQDAAQARALLLAEIDAMANARGRAAAQSSAAVQQQPPQQPVAQRRTPRQRPAAWQDPGFGGGTAGAQAVDRSFATLPTTLGMDATPSGLLTATSGQRAPSSTRRMLVTAFGDPAHARSSVILAEVLGTPLGLR